MSFIKVWVDEHTSKTFSFQPNTTVDDLKKLMGEKLEISASLTAAHAICERPDGSPYDAAETITSIMNRKGKDVKLWWKKMGEVGQAKPREETELVLEYPDYVEDTTAPDWIRLQRRIFTRWVNQKLAKRGIKIKDVVRDLSDGVVLINLIEVLTEKQYTGKYDKQPKARPKKMENANFALQFLFQHVDMKVKPSAEALVDSDEKNILGMMWTVILKYIKVNDDASDEGLAALNAKDALLLWCKNRVAGYKDVDIEKTGWKGFGDGMALCALIHKAKPAYIPLESLSKENGPGNIKIAFDAAKLLWELDPILTPEEFPKLDENTMMVFVSDYYYGLSDLRKRDLAARRIGRVIHVTFENDGRRAEYKEKTEKINALIDKAKDLLEDKTVHNTMAGAKKRVEDFYQYKSSDKNAILELQLYLEALFHALQTSLTQHKRPPYVAAKNCSITELQESIKYLERLETEQNLALHGELHRQHKLAKLDIEQHNSVYLKLKNWVAVKETYLKKKEQVDSTSSAQLHLRLLDAFKKESNALYETAFSNQLRRIGSELRENLYEKVEEIISRENEIDRGFTNLSQLADAKRAILEDDLLREQFRENVTLMNLQHLDKNTYLLNWIAEKENYLNLRENINSVSSAQTYLSLLTVYENENSAMVQNNLAFYKKLGEDILAQKYETQYSRYVFENPDEIKQRMVNIGKKWVELKKLSADKKKWLEEVLALEVEKEKTRLEFAHLASEFIRSTKDVMENLAIEHFGFSPQEVEKYKSTLDQNTLNISAQFIKMKSDYEAVHAKLQQLNVTENTYTTNTPEDLEKALAEMNSSLDARNNAYKIELERQRSDDRLCKQYADLVEPFAKWVIGEKESMSISKSALEKQLEYVNERISKQDTEGAKLAEIRTVMQDINYKGITSNPYTGLTLTDIEVLWTQYLTFLQRKKVNLEEEIEYQITHGISRDILREIDENFTKYDTNKNGAIDRKELKACLFALNEEKTSSELDRLMVTYGNEKGVITRDKFTALMVSLYGDTGSKDQIIADFNHINRGGKELDVTKLPVVRVSKLELVMDPKDIGELQKAAPALEEGLDYSAWCADVFSR